MLTYSTRHRLPTSRCQFALYGRLPIISYTGFTDCSCSVTFKRRSSLSPRWQPLGHLLWNQLQFLVHQSLKHCIRVGIATAKFGLVYIKVCKYTEFRSRLCVIRFSGDAYHRIQLAFWSTSDLMITAALYCSIMLSLHNLVFTCA